MTYTDACMKEAKKGEKWAREQQEDNTKQTAQKLLTEWERNGRRVVLYASFSSPFLGCYRLRCCMSLLSNWYAVSRSEHGCVCARMQDLFDSNREGTQWQNEIKENKHSQTWIKMSAYISLRARDTWTALGIKAEQTKKQTPDEWKRASEQAKTKRDSPKKIVNNFIA